MLNYKAPANLLAGKTIMVTGASDGIGRAAALTYSQHGARVILHGRDHKKLQTVASEIAAMTGLTAPLQLPCDLLTAQPADYQRLAQHIRQYSPVLDGLLLNAGILGPLQPLEQVALDSWQQVLHVNLTSNLLLVQALLPALRVSTAASVIFTSSGVGRQGRALWGSYAVSKFATEGLMQVLADELRTTSIRVNAINPGATRTQMRASARPQEDPLTLATPAQLMPLYLYLMGRDGAGIHGQSLDAQPRR